MYVLLKGTTRLTAVVFEENQLVKLNFFWVIAGATGMGKGRFHVANVLSALIWTPAMLAPGYVAAGGLRVAYFRHRSASGNIRHKAAVAKIGHLRVE